MKKILTICLAVMMISAGVNAKEYKHSVGVVAGSGLGVQYKGFPMKHFTIIEEFGYLGSYAAADSDLCEVRVLACLSQGPEETRY